MPPKKSLICFCPFINWDQQTQHYRERICRALKIVINEILFTGVKFNELSKPNITKLFICTFKANEPAPKTVDRVAFVWNANHNDIANSQIVLSPVLSGRLVSFLCG